MRGMRNRNEHTEIVIDEDIQRYTGIKRKMRTKVGKETEKTKRHRDR